MSGAARRKRSTEARRLAERDGLRRMVTAHCPLKQAAGRAGRSGSLGLDGSRRHVHAGAAGLLCRHMRVGAAALLYTTRHGLKIELERGSRFCA